MADQHDPIDSWLERDVRPLLPPPGTLDRIRSRARRRKRAQVLTAVAGCAVVVAGIATAPQLAAALHGSPGHGSAIGTGPRPTVTRQAPAPTTSATGTSAPQAHSARPDAQHSTLTAGTPTADRVPAGFQPSSVTFVGTGRGGVVGAVIGQAVGVKCATKFCTSMAQTSDYGHKWSGLAAPVVGGPQGGTGVSQLRFVDLKHGWAFGPGLWRTSEGGWPWSAEDTYGMRVTALEAAGRTAVAVFASCTGTGADYASNCTSFRLYRSAAGSSSWSAVTTPASFQTITSSRPSATSLIIAGGTTGYLLTPSGAVLSGPVAGGAWQVAGKAPCAPGTAQLSGAPAAAQLASGRGLLLACDAGPQTTIYSSADGSTWHKLAVVPVTGSATSLGSNSTGQAVLATTSGLYYSANNGKTWQAATVAGAPTRGFSYVGMTNAVQGVALPADPSLGEIFVTADGGRTWTASAVRSR